MTKSEIFRLGFERGYGVASWVDLPEIGTKLPRDVDWVGIGIVTSVEDAYEAFSMIAYENEAHSRCYSPFEFTAQELNNMEDDMEITFEPWTTFEEGIQAGIDKNWQKRMQGYYK
jgi:hypothetical protein